MERAMPTLSSFSLYDSLSQKKRPFVPVLPGEISLYVCGVTVYDRCHLGHARVYTVFDSLIRYWRSLGWAVNYVRNITDIDDKIIKRAQENKQSFTTLADNSLAEMHADFKALGLLEPDAEPRVSRWMQDIIDLIQALVDKEVAYVAVNGDVCFKVSTYKAYGSLSHQRLDALLSEKPEDHDFVLWKMAKPDEPSWESPWGLGRPGWHSECSAMSTGLLGSTIDIHGGGCDLLFPHHENERAQAECLTGKDFVHYWLHVGFVEIQKEKMSKSLGNFTTIADVLSSYHPEVLRFLFLQSHYRSPLPFEEEGLIAAKQGLDRLYQVVKARKNKTEREKENVLQEHDGSRRFYAALEDDFNTPQALSVLFECASQYFKSAEDTAAQRLYDCGSILGLFQDEEGYFRYNTDVDNHWVDACIAERNTARRDGDFAKADAIRKMLQEHKVLLEDRPEGTLWKKV
jgi:cysteinyl-tRNA synthetase